MAKSNRKKPSRRPAGPGAGAQRKTQPARARQPRTDRRFLYAVTALAALAAVALVLSQGGNGGNEPGTATPGDLLRTEAPWNPQSDGLRERVEAAGFPPVGDESFHVHALLSVYVEGEQVPVPANIGIDTRSGYHSPLHTHTPDGVIHFEADEPSPFLLQQVFSMWGVEFTADRLGAYTPTGDNQIHVYVNGQPIDDPVTYELQQGDNIVVAYGEAGSFPTEPPDDALANS